MTSFAHDAPDASYGADTPTSGVTRLGFAPAAAVTYQEEPAEIDPSPVEGLERTSGRYTFTPTTPMSQAEFDAALDDFQVTSDHFATDAELAAHAAVCGLTVTVRPRDPVDVPGLLTEAAAFAAEVEGVARAQAVLDPLLDALSARVTEAEFKAALNGLDFGDFDGVHAHLERCLAGLGDGVSAGRAAKADGYQRQADELHAAGDQLGAGLLTEMAAEARRPRGTAAAAPPTPGAVPPALGVVPPPTAAMPGAPAPDADPDAAAAYEAQADAIAVGTAERAREFGALRSELAPHLATLGADPAAQLAELEALMMMALADRAEVVEAIKSGRMARLGLRARQLAATATGSKQNWIKLREGAAGEWTVRRAPMTDAELDALLSSEPVRPKIMQLFYDRGIHVLAGPPGCGKTWIALNACRSVVPAVRAPGSAETAPFGVYLDLDGNVTTHQRALDLGLDREAVKRRDVDIVNVPKEAHERGQEVMATVRAMVTAMTEEPPRVVIIDSMARLMAESGEDSNNSDGVTRIMNMLQPLADVACLIILDHAGHAADDRPSGSVAKIGATRAVLTLRESGIDNEAHPDTFASSSVTVTKDRDGGIKAHAAGDDTEARPRAGQICIDKDPATGRITLRFIPASQSAAAKERRASDAGQAVAQEAREAVLAAVKAADEAAVTVEEARVRGVEVKAPLSHKGIVSAVWPLFEKREGFKKSDLDAVIRQLRETKGIVERIANYGNQGGGVRFRLPGPIG